MRWNEVSKLRAGAVIGRFSRRRALVSVLVLLERPKRDRVLGELLRAKCFDLLATEIRMATQHEMAECELMEGED